MPDRVLGDKWLASQFDSTPKYDNWLSRHRVIDQVSRDRYFLRTIDLAELIWIGQKNQTVRRVIDDLLRLPIRPILTELRFAAHLVTQKCEFEARRPCGIKREDYDFGVRFESGEWGCAEAKFRHQFLDDIERSITNTLTKARRQMPSNRPCAVFIEFDHNWVVQAGRDGMAVMLEALHKEMNKHNRLVNVSLASQDWEIYPNRYQNEGRLFEITSKTSEFVEKPIIFSKNFDENRPTLLGTLFPEKGAFQTGIRPNPNFGPMN